MIRKRYGEFECPVCGESFLDRRKLSGHIGGAHRKNITKSSEVIKCKFCHTKLIEGKNWADWAIKQRNLVCIPCKNSQNRESYRNKIIKRKEAMDKAKGI